MHILTTATTVLSSAAAVASLSIPPPPSSPPAAAAALDRRQAYGLVGNGFGGPEKKLGNQYNYWTVLPNGTVDLTRGATMKISEPKVIPMVKTASNPAIIVEPRRTVLCLVDYQNLFLHPSLAPAAEAGRAAASGPAVDMIKAFRRTGMKVAWVNWGLTKYDLSMMPPAFMAGFSGGTMQPDKSFGGEMGMVEDSDNNNNQNSTKNTVDAGPMLMRDTWNARPWGPLGPLMDEGLAAGTDLLFHKNRLSGLWGAQTPFGLWLQENQVTTIFFGGVNADQCVWSTLVDAHFKGYDTVYVDDLSATVSPDYATQMTRYNADGYGFLGNSSEILAALG
ncbi:isochorismatase hydrolase [Apiospora rasikravindrae]|uniref:Isochorismatase hydrolase n=1 Tax=Apiospora rasikravindrae TaxID=990691 RepID=A0ABR1RYZ9_9PEZI